MFISDNTKAILLLTAPLLLGKNNSDVKLLTNKEYHQLAVYLKNINKQPADLLTENVENIINSYGKLDFFRVQKLLNRGFLLSQVLDYWQQRNIWVISRADKAYPNRLKSRLIENAPPILYGCGNINLLNMGGLAIVGSRNIDDELVNYTMKIAALSAHTQKMVISGGAKGTDLSAMQGALNAGGFVCGVLANNLEKSALDANNRLVLQENRLVLISACDPKSRFTIGNAMQRNKYIYALSDIGLIVNSDLNEGGTWAGAIEQLNKYQQIPIYIRSTGKTSDGLNALKDKGALLWQNPNTPIELLAIFDNCPLDNQLTKFKQQVDNHTKNKQDEQISPEQELFTLIRKLIEQQLKEPKKEQDLAKIFNVSSKQMKSWLERLIDEGLIIKKGKPIYYTLKAQNSNLDLFSS